MDPSLASLFSSPICNTAHVCGTKFTVTLRSRPRPRLPSPTRRDYVCVYMSGSVFTLHPPLPHPISSSLLISCPPRPPTLPPPPPPSSQRCRVLLSLARQQSANGQSGCSAASSRRASSAAASVQPEIGGSVLRSDGSFNAPGANAHVCYQLQPARGLRSKAAADVAQSVALLVCVVVEFVGTHKARKGF